MTKSDKKKSDEMVDRAIDKTDPVKEPPTVGKPVIIDPSAEPRAPIVPDPKIEKK